MTTFQGPRYVSYFWNRVYLKEGRGEEVGQTMQTVRIPVTDTDRKRFPEVASRRTIKVRQEWDGTIKEIK